jgi:hypothetical protein
MTTVGRGGPAGLIMPSAFWEQLHEQQSVHETQDVDADAAMSISITGNINRIRIPGKGWAFVAVT